MTDKPATASQQNSAKKNVKQGISSRTNRYSGEDGNILMLGLGVILLVLALLVGMTTIGSIYLEKKKLNNVADTAALAYSDVSTVNAYYEQVERAVGAEHIRRTDPLEVAREIAAFTAGNLGVEGDVELWVEHAGNHERLVVTASLKRRFFVSPSAQITKDVTVSSVGAAVNVESE